MPETDENAALPLADRLREVCAQAAGGGPDPITCSVGVVTYEQPPRDVEELLASADALMYEAKAAGGDDVRQANKSTVAAPCDPCPRNEGDKRRPRTEPQRDEHPGKGLR